VGAELIRIIAGELKGRRLETPDWPGLRPTSDRLRETLYNVLAGRVVGARALDGFAGTGAVGIEALSRGAAHVTFVEQDPRSVRLIERNLSRCGVNDRYAIIRVRFADAQPPPAGPWDLVLLDPPYGQAELDAALAAAGPLVAASGLVVIEHAWRDTPPERAGRLALSRRLKSGDSALAFYRVEESGP
jgi:16S rRNA (guanine(966)-N(2))-methyltransferase RsmD